MSGQFSDDSLGHTFDKKNARRHLPQIMNSKILDPGAVASRLKLLSNVPKMHLLAGKSNIRSVSRKNVFVSSQTWKCFERPNRFPGERQSFWPPILRPRNVN